ncbi:type II toxin-antitoxin system RelE family toxin [Methylomonas rivi]|uniref:Type II toxin-antitoxin system RelE/ParE family toxin n=1 Tax=Methylomonas rivi TaxID=2952226 RepID=A0ABT1U3V7_9GAMM|nr:type II toxin-antitoxin system RelE/ParE family toxin [Methylomonas sp. WSC-6]MCQ8128306.1 type II toxin-antitoxin system RelE/ParE family toxin [Methylomonas sp. WSC-6]
MAYKIEFTPKAAKQFSKLDQATKKRIKEVLLRIEALEDPRAVGKNLQGELAGLWRYRAGNYRILTRIIDDKLVILVVTVGHRREIYD